MHNFSSMTIREIALEMPITTRVFEDLKIDYCCHGDTMFGEACRNAGTDPEKVMKKLDRVIDTLGNREHEWMADAALGELIDHILETHHIYTRDELEQLAPLMDKVASRHGEHYGYLLELKDLLRQVSEDLKPHMMKEEVVLFPYIRDLESKQLSSTKPPFGTVQNPVGRMRMEHETVGEVLAKMRAVTHDYTLPDGVCPSFTALFHRLAALEADLHQHIHIENNILFPRAVELEHKTFSLSME